MKFSVFPQNSAIAGRPVFEAFIASLKDDNIDVVENNMDADVAVIWSVLWHGRMSANKAVWDHYRSQNKPVIVLEVGGIKRNETWKVGVNGINRDASFGNEECDEKRVKKLGLELKPWKTAGSDIIVCGQHGASEQWRGMPPVDEWMINITKEIRQYTDKRIVLRPHPRHKVTLDFGKFINVLVANPKQIEGTYDDFNFEEALQRSWAVVCHSSNPAINAVMGGIPVFVSSSSLCYDVGLDILDLSKINEPLYPDRRQWLRDLSYTEWTIDEIGAGEPWDRIKGMINYAR